MLGAGVSRGSLRLTRSEKDDRRRRGGQGSSTLSTSLISSTGRSKNYTTQGKGAMSKYVLQVGSEVLSKGKSRRKC